MGDSKALPILGGVLLVLFLPLLIVLALIVGALAGMGSAAADCVPTQSQGNALAWPTDRHDIDQDWSEGAGRGQSPHRGIDFDVEAGSKVYAVEDGKIVSIADNQVRIQHDESLETRYKYLQDITVRVDQEIGRGEQIGLSGSEDEASPGLRGDHLHFELWVENDDGELEAVDPDPDDDTFGDATEETDSGCCSSLVGSTNQQKAFNYFASNGYSKEQAAGIVGNMIHESGVEPGRLQNTSPGHVTNPSDAVGSSLGWGIVQWTPAGKMINPSRSNGVDDAVIGSLEYQLEFLKKQLDGETAIAEGHAGDMLKRATTAEDAAVAFSRYFERFAGSDDLSNPRYAERKATAREVFGTFEGGAPSGSGTACTGGRPKGPVDTTFPPETASVSDPTGTGGRVTPRTAAMYKEAKKDGLEGLETFCFAHRDTGGEHPLGRACDFMMSALGKMPTASQKQKGWALANWAVYNQARLGVWYVIWEGKIWSASHPDEGWRTYNGGGMYNCPGTDVTGCHFDHVHISMY